MYSGEVVQDFLEEFLDFLNLTGRLVRHVIAKKSFELIGRYFWT